MGEALSVLPLTIGSVAKSMEVFPNPVAADVAGEGERPEPSEKAAWMAKIMKDLEMPHDAAKAQPFHDDDDDRDELSLEFLDKDMRTQIARRQVASRRALRKGRSVKIIRKRKRAVAEIPSSSGSALEVAAHAAAPVAPVAPVEEAAPVAPVEEAAPVAPAQPLEKAKPKVALFIPN
jgi:hypothetical protein